MSVIDLVKVVRVKQWTKNVFVFAAFIFVKGWTHPGYSVSVFLAFLAMCFASSATYLVNDIYDVEKDRAHPVKKNRPIASGRIPVGFAFALAIVLLALSFALGWLSDVNVVFGLAAYLGLQVIYNVSWRNKSVADVACIALGFVG